MTDTVGTRPGNAAKQIAALTLQRTGDLVVDARTVLTWLLTALGAPAGFAGLLVPIRESGSMLPQTALMPWVTRLRVRRWVWVLGAGVQAASAATMALIAATLEGTLAGVAILGSLAVFAVGRSLSSIASKDVLGRTIEQGRRGRINGAATVAAGVVAITVGVAMRAVGGEDTPASTFAWLLIGAAFAWVLAAGTYATIDEPEGEHEDTTSLRDAMSDAVHLLRDDAVFRRFLVARTLLLVSALSPPFVVVLASRLGGGGLSGLGPFVFSSGVASLVGGGLWGRAADRSSRRVMMAAAGSSSLIVLALLLALRFDALREVTLLYPAAYLLLALAHTGTRIGRKTYVVDIAGGNQRTEYVAVSNTAMGLLLLVTGAVSAGVAVFGVEAALLLLAVLGLTGVAVSRSLPEAAG